MKKIVFLLIVILLLTTTGFSQELKPEEYAVYSAVLEQIYPSSPKMFVIYSESSDREDLGENSVDYFEKNSASSQWGMSTVKLDKDMVKDYNDKNQKKYPMDKDSFSVDQEIVLLTEGESDAIFWGGGRWGEFNSKFPGSSGTIELSRVGFNNDKTEAILYFGNQQDRLMGQGFYLLLARNGDSWRIIDRCSIWIS